MREKIWPVDHAHKDFIHQIISFESDELETKSLSFYADGFPGLVFFESQGKVTIFAGSESKQMEPLFVYGQTIEPVKIVFEAPFRMVMLQLFPSVIRSAFQIPISELTNSCWTIPRNEWHTLQITNEDLSKSELEVITTNLVQFIVNRTQNLVIDFILHECIRIIILNQGNYHLKKLCNQFQISERTLQRRFESYVGLTPKQFTNIIRFQSSLNLLSKSKDERLTDIAYESGYFDQSHFIRQFKIFTKQKPFRFREKI